jgi:hypothetical protein
MRLTAPGEDFAALSGKPCSLLLVMRSNRASPAVYMRFACLAKRRR